MRKIWTLMTFGALRAPGALIEFGVLGAFVALGACTTGSAEGAGPSPVQMAVSQPVVVNGLEFTTEAPSKWICGVTQFEVKLRIKNVTSKQIIYSTESCKRFDLKDASGKLIDINDRGRDSTEPPAYVQVLPGKTIERLTYVDLKRNLAETILYINSIIGFSESPPLKDGKYFESMKIHFSRANERKWEEEEKQPGHGSLWQIAPTSRRGYLDQYHANASDLWEGDLVTSPLGVEVRAK